MTWEVKVVEAGRHGHVEYVEDGHTCQCYWEFGGDNTLAIITVPTSEQWDIKYPWARGRRHEILSRIANETRRQRAPAASIEWDETRNVIYLRQE